ncbi:hypothetical protein QWZ16_02105 [Vibrio ostreicida]|uniref:Uncharacterized protein n=1 Tax=Vibrio ostreicida TaxID=526588 RepID=A0ABT8BR21_9VIBR|nr:hypothetical protein [Vibrio ostreicida]MDN3608572.1 hypothetical protein [Vibrio ostreicida]
METLSPEHRSGLFFARLKRVCHVFIKRCLECLFGAKTSDNNTNRLFWEAGVQSVMNPNIGGRRVGGPLLDLKLSSPASRVLL